MGHKKRRLILFGKHYDGAHANTLSDIPGNFI